MRSAQEELDRQGAKLRKSAASGKQIVDETRRADKNVDLLVAEAKAGRFRQLLTCCCSCCCGDSDKSIRRKDHNEPKRDASGQSSPGDPDDDDQYDISGTEALLERLRRTIKEGKGKEAHQVSWKRTLAPPLTGVGPRGGQQHVDVWHRQMNASLTQLQQMAEEMADSLEEQTRLAQLMTIYLNHGIDQMLGANKKLAAAKSSF